MKRTLIFIITISLAASWTLAQDIQTADKFLSGVSDTYAKMVDYQADLSISSGKNVMQGKIIYKAPSLLRVDFSNPANQVIFFNGENLIVYVPEYRAVLSQQTGAKGGTAGAGIATGAGLRILMRSYTVAYLSTPVPVALISGSTETAVMLILTRNSVAEGYTTIKLAIDPKTMYIRRIEGTTLSNDTFVFDFTRIIANQSIPDSRFIYDAPAGANEYTNFLFKPEN